MCWFLFTVRFGWAPLLVGGVGVGGFFFGHPWLLPSLFSLFLLIHDVFLYARTDFCLSLVFFGNYYRWLVEIRGRYRYIGWFVTLWAGPSHS